MTLVGAGLGALLGGMPAGIVPIGAGVYLMVVADAARRQITQEMSALTDLVEVLKEVRAIVDAQLPR